MVEYEIAVVGPKEICFGFKAAGVSRVIEVADAAQALHAIEKLVADAGVGLIIVGESVASESLDFIADVSQNRFLPAIAVIQDSVQARKLSARVISATIERATGISFLTEK
ncbi:MAG: V-type ATP synthase subunit F [Candidatus Norongarragalinales archaeon]